jgi:deazaflavin-dependent oxidoreductase (nitroreductase family)
MRAGVPMQLPGRCAAGWPSSEPGKDITGFRDPPLTDFLDVDRRARAEDDGMTASIDTSSHDPTTDPARGDSLMHRLSVRTGGFSRRMAGTRWFPLWGVLRHVGRKSGTAYAIPIVALPTRDGFFIPLPFGDQTQWLKNLQAADRAGLRHGGREYVIERPEVLDLTMAGRDLPAWVRFASGRVGIDRFVRVHRVDG